MDKLAEKRFIFAELETQREPDLAVQSRRGWYVRDRNGTYQVRPQEEKVLAVQ